MDNQETEAKFYVRGLNMIEMRLQKLKAHLIQPRVLEQNIRFDLPDGGLCAEGRVLRLRRDTEARLSYKGASAKADGVLTHQEIEFMVGDFDKAKLFLEALGYRSFFFYEKYRTTYTVESNSLPLENQKQASGLQICHIMLDELPFGNFVEIEGETIEAIKSIASQLGLKWETAIPTSYHLLFENLRKAKNLTFQDLSFENFKGLNFSAVDLNAQYADE